MQSFSQFVAEAQTVYRAYHSTDRKFRKFSLAYARQPLFWFAADPNTLRGPGAMGASRTGQIATVDLTITNPAGPKEYHNLTIGELKGRGYDGVIMPSPEQPSVFIVFDPAQITIVRWEPTVVP